MPGLVSKVSSNAALNGINKFERKISGTGAVRVGKGFILFISNEDVDDIIKIIKSLGNSGILIVRITKAVEHQIKKTRRWISWCFVSTFAFFSDTTCDFLSGKRYYWARSHESRKTI